MWKPNKTIVGAFIEFYFIYSVKMAVSLYKYRENSCCKKGKYINFKT